MRLKPYPDSLSAPARRALAAEGLHRLEDLAERSEREIAQLHGMGPNAIEKIRDALRAKGLGFRESPDPAAE